MSRLTHSANLLFMVLMLLLVSMSLTRSAYAWNPGTPPAAFDVVAKRILNLKTCEWPDRITLVRLVDEKSERISPSEAASKIMNKNDVLIAIDTENWSDETLLFGPVSHVPSKQQLDGLIGKKTCVQ